MLYSAEEIFAVEGFLVNFAELFFSIQENGTNFVELIFAIERFRYYSFEIFLQHFTDQTKRKDYRDKKFNSNIAKSVLFFNKKYL